MESTAPSLLPNHPLGQEDQQDKDSPIPLFIVGLQKSGTSLLSRCLQMDAAVSSPFKAEGHDFWGDVPPFTPTAYPTGTLYQAKGGKQGHLLEASDIDTTITATVHGRWHSLPCLTPILLNKNPYNTLRLGWLRALFPQARIVAMVRNPLANTYSLAKKYLPHQGRGKAPEEGWWGVKPPQWREIIQEDKLEQCARQWLTVNQHLLANAWHVDLYLTYEAFCQQPRLWLQRILQLCQPHRVDPPPIVLPLQNCDGEYLTGARLRSNNRYFHERGNLSLPAHTVTEFPPLTAEQTRRIEKLAWPLWQAFREIQKSKMPPEAIKKHTP
ncbi:sulfotransferase family protein [Nitrosococcus watsonii]|uniref:Sulfotransferase n=1 Tax=Nitrosococcus watsoni (strain C-113) TaxID=105559 RepID=D8K956_NITWC|nr:sulfotransferase [Nitrosococcus watsonii]ADJ29199.1 conserved hypothetical protein [Nitrosococcus watsonii C-113]